MFFKVPRKSNWLSVAVLSALVVAIPCVGFSDLRADAATTGRPSGTNEVEGVLLLHTGGVMRGTVHRSGDWYQVRQADGAELEIQADRVAGYYSTLREAYESRRPKGKQATPRKHLALAYWCLKQDLVVEAREQLELAQQFGGLQAEKLRLEKELLREENTSQPVPEIAAAPRSRRPVSTSTQQSPWEEFSMEVRRDFVRKIQPMLVKNCCQCHAAKSQRSFRINRAALHGSGDARIIRENFFAVIRQLDRESISDNALLTFAKQAHGASKSEFVKSSKPLRRNQVLLLRDWCQMVYGKATSGSEDLEEAKAKLNVTSAPEEQKRSIRDEFDPEIFNRRVRKDDGSSPALLLNE